MMRPFVGLLAPVIPFLLCACASSQPELQDGLLDRSPLFDVVLDAGLAVAPVGHVDPVADSAEISAFLTNELYLGLLVNMRGVQLVSPDDVLAQMGAAGDEAVEHFLAVRRQLVREEIPSREDLALLSRIVLHRFLLVTWVDETKEMGLEELDRDYVDVSLPADVRRASYEQILGQISGVVIDLWEGEIMWKARQSYRTQKMFGEVAKVANELELTRSTAMGRFAAMLDPNY